MTATASVPAVDVPRAESPWWLHLASGALWLIFGFAILNGRNEMQTLWTIAIVTGSLFIASGVSELVYAVFEPSARSLHLVSGAISLVAGLAVLAWPGHTFLVVAAIIGWYLLITGSLHIASAIAVRTTDPEWWTTLVVGAAEFLLAIWVIGYPGRSLQLLVLWVGLSALVRGLLGLVRGFSLRAGATAPS